MDRCLECNSKIGWLKKRVEEVYCSERCCDEARDRSRKRELQLIAQIEADREALAVAERLRERERLEHEAASVLRTTSDIVKKGDASRAPCPKCGLPWAEEHGVGSFGRTRGHCGRCGFQAEFITVEVCLHCRCSSLVVESEDDARCPRCKSRPRRRRQIA